MEKQTSNMDDFPLPVGSAMSSTANGRRIRRVLPQLKLNKHHRYDPVMVSLGPYHHGRPDLQAVEEYKHKVLEMFISAGGKDREFFYSALLKIVGEIRNCYVGVSMEDGALAEMMLLDACFVISLMEFSIVETENVNDFYHHLGMDATTFLAQDIFFLENQILFFVIRLLLSMRYGGDDGNRLVYQFLSIIAFDDQKVSFIPGEYENQPLHLLEAMHRVYMDHRITDYCEKVPWFITILRRLKLKREQGQITYFNQYSRPFRSVTRLKERGIYFRPSSYFLNDIRFSSYAFWGVLHLPVWFMTTNSKTFFSNMIAYEKSPGNHTVTGLQVTSYINFMKSLIEKPEDVKELREKNIIFSNLGGDEEIVKIFKELDTYGADNVSNFNDVKYRLGEHCSSRAKTWIAELVHTYFRSPWAVIGLLAATFLLCLTFLQTYYTMNPVSR